MQTIAGELINGLTD